MKFQLTQISLLVSGLFLAASANAQSTTDVGTVQVQGSPGGTGSGLIQEEDSARARSSVNRKAIELQSPVNNPYQVINLLPGVSQFSQDGTGLFGGSLRIRGFNSDQLGFTINGAPVNDSGSFTVFPQEYTDSDNLCEVFVTQGSTDSDAPHVGATGGNVGLVSCKPTDTMQTRASQTVGQNALSKTFVKFNTGKFLDDHVKAYLAVSHAETEKFKGPGDAFRDHIETAWDIAFGGGNYFSGSFLYNKAVNNNFRAVSKAQIDQFGYNYDFGTQAPIHQPGVNGTAQNDSTYAPNANIYTGQQNRFYGFNLNPFKNYVATGQAHFNLAPRLALDVTPYMWYGYGTGGNELQTMSEAAGPTRLAGGGRDYNGDGDKLDTIGAYEGSVTKTYRPGVITKLSYDIVGNHVVAGYWFEKARHQQTAPYVAISNTGTADDIWLQNSSQYLLNADGSAAQFRDWYTVTRARSGFLTDNLNLLNDKLTLQLGARYTTLGRTFTNSPNQGSTPLGFGGTGYGGAPYVIEKDYSEFLPNIGLKYQLTDQQSVYINGARNFKGPPNFAYSNLAVSNVPGATPTTVVPLTYVNGVAVNYHIIDPTIQPEKADNYDLGYRYAGDRITASASAFFINYKNRIAAFIDPNTGSAGSAANLGKSTTKGIELEAGYKIMANLTAYTSLSYTKTRISQNLPYGLGTNVEQTAGKEFPDTPNWLAGAALQYQDQHYLAGIDMKLTGKRYSTLVNDDSIGGYTLFGLNAGYKFDSNMFFKNPSIRMNVYNLFSRQYLSLSGPSGSNFGVRALPVAGLPTYSAQTFYVGAPRLIAVTFASDF
jgi:iron complex outermembrane receptor protein